MFRRAGPAASSTLIPCDRGRNACTSSPMANAGSGKTSLMHVLAESLLATPAVSFSYVSCGASSNFDETFRAFAEDVPLLFHRADTALPPGRAGTRRNHRRTCFPPAPSRFVLASDDSSSKAQVGTRTASSDVMRFGRAESAEFRLNVAEFLKNLSDRSIRVQLGHRRRRRQFELSCWRISHLIQRSIFAPRSAEDDRRRGTPAREERRGAEERHPVQR